MKWATIRGNQILKEELRTQAQVVELNDTQRGKFRWLGKKMSPRKNEYNLV